MRILHYIPKGQELVTQYVRTLTGAMGTGCENLVVDDSAEACNQLQERLFDILHIHGCWRNSQAKVVRRARRSGTRIVVSPHGQLEPWVMAANYWQEKLPKLLVYQRHIISKAYAVIIQGKMEEECMRKLGWNRRTVIIRNSLLTVSINPQQMASQTLRLYRKVMDSNPLGVMTADTRQALRNILKTGITGDVRWLQNEPSQPQPSDAWQWHSLMGYACQEHIADTVRRGLRLLRLDEPEYHFEEGCCFLPEGYQPPTSIGDVIGMQFVDENERLMATFRQVCRLIASRQLSIAHLVELDKELRHHDYDEELLSEQLQDASLHRTACRVMQLMHDLTGLDEGFIPITPLADRTTRAIRRQIESRLEI